MEQTFIDSSILVAAVNTNDSLHSRAVVALRGIPGPYLIHEYVVLETAAVLMTQADKALADRFLQEILKNKQFKVVYSTTRFFLSGIDSFLNTKAKLSLVDATLLALSRSYAVLTFDEALNRAIKRRKN